MDPQFYAVRWMTTLFARELPMQETLEFPLSDTFRIWDALLADPERFDMAYCVGLAIVEREKRRLVGGDFAEIISLGERCVTVNATCAFFRT